MPQSQPVSSASAASKYVLPFELVPHPCNQMFCEAMTASLIKTIGKKLSQLTTGENFESVATDIAKYFERHFPGDSPFAEDRNASQFTEQVTAIGLAQVDIPCAVSRNISWLGGALHLSITETKVLLWSYCSYRSSSPAPYSILNRISCSNQEQIWRALGIFFDQPAEDVSLTFAQPCRLHGMGLIDILHRNGETNINSYLAPTSTFNEAIEIPHRSIDGLLARFYEQDESQLFDSRAEIPSEIVSEIFPDRVTVAYLAAMAKKTLKAPHLAALIHWFSQFEFTAEACIPLEGHLDYFTLRKAVRRCFIESGRKNELVSRLSLMQAIYAVAH